jgi:dienelactone hydrolase
MTTLSAGAPLEPARFPVGRRTIVLADPARPQRRLAVDLWYPADVSAAAPSVYELFPGVAFSAASARHEPPARAGRFALILFSHGRTGMRISYSLACEALAARGAVVASCDHPGDALADWLLGTHSDDRTNEVDRVADAHLVLHALLTAAEPVPLDIANAIDHDQVVLAGHSYGAYTAFATVAGSRGVAPHEHVRAIVGYQAYTRSMSDGLLGRVTVPALIVVSERDQVTPPSVDGDRPWALLRGHPTWRLDLAGAGHQAVSDIPLYAELAEHVPGLPQMVREYLVSTAAGSASADGRGWRELLRLQVTTTWAFLQVVLDLDADAGRATAEAIAQEPGLTLRSR